MQITPMFQVDGQYFTTVAEAEAYISENGDRCRLDAFLQHLKDTGTKRISATIVDTVEKFMAFENGTAGNASGSSESIDLPADSVGEPQESKEAVSPAGSVDEGKGSAGTDGPGSSDEKPWSESDDTVRTGEEQETKVEGDTAEVATGKVSAAVESGMSNLEPTEKAKSLFAKRAK